MTTLSLLSYAMALLIAVATPGPAMLSVIARALARGTRAGASVGVGVAIADVCLGALALVGLAALMATMSWLLVVVKYAGAAYLVVLGIRMWRSSEVTSQSESLARGGNCLLGLSVAFSNPKAILFHASLMPLVVDLASLDLMGGAMILGTILLVNLSVMSAYAALAGRSSGYFRTSQRVRLINRVGGGSMLGAAAIVAAR